MSRTTKGPSSSTPTLAIGVDTGGTYTDAVIVDKSCGVVLATAKSPTTYGNLAVGVRNAITAVLEHTGTKQRSAIAQVSLSTTLATNALVEGRGSALAVILIGFDEGMTRRTQLATALPEAQVIQIDGGHRHDGHEHRALDVDALRDAISTHMNAVDAFAVAAHYSVRNPGHEREAERIIKELTGKPVSASCDLSDSLNGPRRALTAAFNARIISLIVQLEQAVQNTLDELILDVPIMMVKGDGSIAVASSLIDRPIETILSGPAASVIGTRFLTGLSDFVIADIGGTTTDVATVIDGWPNLNEQGSDIGGFRTLVKAIDMKTLGLGGDSAVEFNEQDEVIIHSHRVIPLSMLAHRFEHIERQLQLALQGDSGMRSALHYLVLNPRAQGSVLSPREQRFIEQFSEQEPSRFNDVVNGAAGRSCANALIARGILSQSGFTPSDAAHVVGLQDQWSSKAARYAAELLGRSSYRVKGQQVDEQVNALCQDVIDKVVTKSTRLIIEQLAGTSLAGDDALINIAAKGEFSLAHLDLSFKSSLPIAAVGGPAGVFYPTVGERLGTTTQIPSHSAVANAIGAAVGRVRAEATVEITLKEEGGYWVHSQLAPEMLGDGASAIARAEQVAREQVAQLLTEQGGQITHIDVDVTRILIPDSENDSGLISARVTASCESVPRTKRARAS